jgi:hypothetical protein
METRLPYWTQVNVLIKAEVVQTVPSGLTQSFDLARGWANKS